jgi:predicted Zn-dependent protease
MRLIVISLAIALVSGTGVAHAKVHTHAKGKVSVDIPTAWKVKQEKTGVLVGESQDKAVGLLFWVVEKTDAKGAIAQLDKAVEGKITNIKWNKPQQASINGMTGIKNVGTATIEGKEAFIMVAVVGPTPSQMGVIIFGAIEQSKLTEHRAELSNIFDSLAAAK